jgi:hypothetical protein
MNSQNYAAAINVYGVTPHQTSTFTSHLNLQNKANLKIFVSIYKLRTYDKFYPKRNT